VELDPPGALPHPERLVRIAADGSEQDRPGRQGRHRLGMADVGLEDLRHSAEKRVPFRAPPHSDLRGPELPAVRVVAHMPARRQGEQLVAVADPQQRNARGQDVPDPAGRLHAPRFPIGHHRVGAGDDGRRDSGGVRQRVAERRAPYRHPGEVDAEPGRGPVLEIPGGGRKLRERASQLHDQDLSVHLRL